MFAARGERIICWIALGASAVGMANLGDLPTSGRASGVGEVLPDAPQKHYFAAVSAAFDNAPDRPKRLSSESLPAPKAAT